MSGSLPRTLLLTGTPPQSVGVGGIYLSDLCSFLPEEKLRVAWVQASDGGGQRGASGDDVRQRTFQVDFEQRLSSRFGRAGRFFQMLGQMARNRRSVSEQVASCVEWARAQRVEQVWAVLDSPLSMKMAEPVAATLGVPLMVMVWDDILHNIRYFRLDSFTAKVLAAKFDRTVRRSARSAVISEAMQAEYKTRYGVSPVVMRHGLDATLAKDAGRARGGGDEIIVGFAGSVTARSALEALLAAFDQMGWSLGGRPIKLRVLGGHRLTLSATVARNIEYLGWRPTVQDALALLAECAVNYLPQPFESEWEPFARLSFPTKLGTYLSAGAPVLVHAPAGASLPEFLGRYPFGVWCDSLDSADLEQAMVKLLDPALANGYANARRRALDAEFERDVFRTRFADFLGVDPVELRA